MAPPQTGLTNFGLHVLHDAPVPQQTTILAAGLGRSGTTMLSRIMSALGLYMGRVLTPQSNEDKEIQLLIKAGDMAGFEEICRVRDAQHDVWGFKCPAARGHIANLATHMRNPRAIVVFRDVLAISLRNNISVGAELVDAMEAAVRGNAVLISQVVTAEVPTLMVSYEKALQYPERCVQAIADHCGITVSHDQISEIAASCVRNGDKAYLGIA
jgi:hypothetical protein